LTLISGAVRQSFYGWINASPDCGLNYLSIRPSLCQGADGGGFCSPSLPPSSAGQCFPAGFRERPHTVWSARNFFPPSLRLERGRQAGPFKFCIEPLLVPQINTAQNPAWFPITFGGSDTRAWTICKAPGQTIGLRPENCDEAAIERIRSIDPAFNTARRTIWIRTSRAPGIIGNFPPGFEAALPGEMVSSLAYYYPRITGSHWADQTLRPVPPPNGPITPITVTEGPTAARPESGVQKTQNPCDRSRGQFHVQYSNLAALQPRTSTDGPEISRSGLSPNHWSLADQFEAWEKAKGDIYAGLAGLARTRPATEQPEPPFFRQGPSPMDGAGVDVQAILRVRAASNGSAWARRGVITKAGRT